MYIPSALATTKTLNAGRVREMLNAQPSEVVEINTSSYPKLEVGIVFTH